MEYTGNLRKMAVSLDENNVAQYKMRLYDILEPKHEVSINELVGKDISLRFEHEIHCVVSGKKIKKAYGEGMDFNIWRKSPLAVESIIRPELSQIHLGIALRDKEWEERNHLQPHHVYLAQGGGIKVGVTRKTQVPSRWIDQGAVKALIIAETPYRQAAGLIEVALKDHIADKTNWRKMLKNEINRAIDLTQIREMLLPKVPSELSQYLINDKEVVNIAYPVIMYPEKVNSLKFDKEPTINKRLVGIKGQYLIFEDGSVINIRSHTAYKVTLEF